MIGKEWPLHTPINEKMFLAFVRWSKHLGYGRMMQIISHEWYRHDPVGAALANTCYGLLEGDERAAYEALARSDPVFALAAQPGRSGDEGDH